MKFEEHNRIIYTKDEYHKKFDIGDKFCDKENNKWYYKGYLVHRENGPAIEWIDGSKWWYKNGKIHREDDPAVEWSYGSKSWYLNNIRYSENDYWRIMNIKRKVRILNEI